MARIEHGITLIRGGRLADAAKRRAELADVLVEDGVIRAVGTALPTPAEAREIDATGMLLHPGLINAHTHGHGGLARGQGDKWTLELLLAAAPWIGGNRALADKKLTTQICVAEMVLKGCTAAYDLYYEYPLPTREGMDAAAEAYAEVGMRAVVAPMVADRTGNPGPLRGVACRTEGGRGQAAPRAVRRDALGDRRDPEALALGRPGHSHRGRAHHPAPLHGPLHVRLRDPRTRAWRRPAQPRGGK